MNVCTKFEVRSCTHSWDNWLYPQNLGSPWVCPRSLFSKIFSGLLFEWTLWMHLPNLKSVASPVPEIIGVSQKIGQSLDTPTPPFLQNFNGLLFGWTLWISWPNPKSVASPVPEIIVSDRSFGWSCEPQSWGRGSRRGSGMVRFERALVSSYRPSIVTFPLPLRVSENVTFVLQHSTFSPPQL